LVENFSRAKRAYRIRPHPGAVFRSGKVAANLESSRSGFGGNADAERNSEGFAAQKEEIADAFATPEKEKNADWNSEGVAKPE
jgi:hypothetical protein